MANECVINLYSSYDDRGSVSSTLKRRIPIDVSAIIPGKALPGWTFSQEPPVVDYYDGECMELSYEGKQLKVMVGEGMLKLFSASVAENIYVHESVVGYLALESVRSSISRDFPVMFLHGSFNALVRTFLSEPALADDPVAVKRYMWVFIVAENLFFLDDGTLAELHRLADKGNRYALFGLGRYHYYVHPEQNSSDIAERCFRRAYQCGYPEGAAGLSMMYRSGDLGLVDRLRAKTLQTEAMEQKCDLAAYSYLRDLIFGLNGVTADPAKAVEFIDGLIRADEDNPMWRYMRGWAVQYSGKLSDARNDYEAAARGGIIAAWSFRALALSYNDEGELVDREAFSAALELGAAHRDCFCVYFQALLRVQDFDNMPEYRQLCERDMFVSLMKRAYNMGAKEAAVYLGNTYYYGWYRIIKDNDEAYKWYARASILASCEAYEQMFIMSLNGDISDEDGNGQHFRDMCAVYGARFGSSDMLNEAVIAYTHGRLTAFASEIEQYYMPVFDKNYKSMDSSVRQEEPDGADVDECLDDDGRYDAYV